LVVGHIWRLKLLSSPRHPALSGRIFVGREHWPDADEMRAFWDSEDGRRSWTSS
jgi:hypothetical protein